MWPNRKISVTNNGSHIEFSALYRPLQYLCSRRFAYPLLTLLFIFAHLRSTLLPKPRRYTASSLPPIYHL
jgi:hypothetical protein